MNKSRRIRLGRECSTNGEEECIYDIGGKPRRKETTGKTKTYVGQYYVKWILER
jgi:hypothetical protein